MAFLLFCPCFSMTYIKKLHKWETLVDNQWKWKLAPAYDLTLCAEGYNGEHVTSVNGTGRPTLHDFLTVGTKIKMNERHCRKLIEEVRDNCSELKGSFEL